MTQVKQWTICFTEAYQTKRTSTCRVVRSYAFFLKIYCTHEIFNINKTLLQKYNCTTGYFIFFWGGAHKMRPQNLALTNHTFDPRQHVYTCTSILVRMTCGLPTYYKCISNGLPQVTSLKPCKTRPIFSRRIL